MAPVRTSTRRAQRDHVQQTLSVQHDVQAHHQVEQDPKNALFLDPMMGTPLSIYVDKDVEDREQIVELITKNGGVVSPGYSGVVHILVNPRKESGQNLYRQYAGKKNKIVLDAVWAIECVTAGELQTYQTNWAGCRVTGTEQVISSTDAAGSSSNQAGPSTLQTTAHPDTVLAEQMVAPTIMQQPPQPSIPQPSIAAAIPQQTYQYQVYSHEAMHAATSAPPQTWHTAAATMQAHEAHMSHQQQMELQHHGYATAEQHAWHSDYHRHTAQSTDGMVNGVQQSFEYDTREPQTSWIADAAQYYQQQFGAYPYAEPQYLPQEPGPSNVPPPPEEPAAPDPPRGRKRTRNHPQPAPPASSLVVNRRNPAARSPTPPSRVVKSTYGGNLFTSDDVMYLKKYIDYCQEQGLVLSLREICEKVAIKAPHHTFYSWRRYCNKHQIRLRGYAMDIGEENNTPDPAEQPAPQPEPPMPEPVPQLTTSGIGPGTVAAAKQIAAADINRDRSPTPPRALYRSTTGKGVAFTEEDVTFLVRFLEYRTRIQGGKVDMVLFWKDVAAKAPHHSRASWMKFWRRHKHELDHTEHDEPLPPPPEKKMRYSKEDDVLLAKFFCNRPEGTSDRVFQQFAREHPHHPWKGWQEHYRIHKAKIDHLISKLRNGENIDAEGEED
ncbi:hypothetical protein K474DRAFT_1681646 [Panus rudis PR-1116 ss-1]|nr:hypothetical protein K474DRAFT_1681646 [Panus rudis PR-1116 ss-1]